MMIIGSVKVLLCSLAVAYFVLMRMYVRAWRQLPKSSVPQDFVPAVGISVIIPARNEAANIENCVRSIVAQHYPAALFEIIIVDDHSEDDTALLVKNLRLPQVQVLDLAAYLQGKNINSYKKAAIAYGIAQARHPLIVCTDADCTTPPLWLRSIAHQYHTNPYRLLTAPVAFEGEQSFFQRFQSLDFAGMMLITGASLHKRLSLMGNGANLSYEKAVFYEVGGFDQIDTVASGDDLLLIQKIAAYYPQGISFLKNTAAIVTTAACPTWKDFLQQRIRWASKSNQYNDWKIKSILLGVYLLNVSLLFLPLVALFDIRWCWVWIFQIFVKIIADYFFLKEAVSFFGRGDLMRIFLPAQLLHIIYIVWAGWAGNWKRYEWKGRRVQ